MQTLLFEPFLIRPHSLHTLADAVAAMYADMRTNPADFGTEQQLRNLYYLVRWASDALCEVLAKARIEIALEDILGLDDVLIRYALEHNTDRKHASVYATGCRKIIQYARSRGWSCGLVLRIEEWVPIEVALAKHRDGAVQIAKFLAGAGKTPGDTTEADLQSWHVCATKEHGMLPDTADRILARFRGRMRLSGLDHLFPHLDLKSKKRSGYRKKKGEIKLKIGSELAELVASRSPKYLADRAARKALRPSSIEHVVDSFCQIHGCLEDELERGPFESLAQMITTTNLCEAIDWLVSERDLLRQGIYRILEPILAVASMFPDLDCGEVRKHIKKVTSEPNHRMRARKQAKALPYGDLEEIPDRLQQRIDAGDLSETDAAWLLHDKALVSVLLELAFRQRNIRECKWLDTPGANLVWRKLNPKDLHDLEIPACVRAAYDADHSRKFLMFVFNEDETKGKRAQTEVIPLDLAATLQAFLDVRDKLLQHENVKNGTSVDDPGTLFMNRHCHPLREHNLRSLVRRLTRNYAGKSVPPHLWRDILAAHFRLLLAICVETDSNKLSKRFWHKDQPTTDKYSHLDKALAGIAALNQQYRENQTQRKETSEQLAQLEPRRERAA